jgi:hypothetical protein
MQFYTLTLTAEQLHQVVEGLGMRIERMQSDPTYYQADEVEAAKAALDHATHTAWATGKPPAE